MNLIDTVWWNVLGACLFFGLFVLLAWCLYDARREAIAEVEKELQLNQYAKEGECYEVV